MTDDVDEMSAAPRGSVSVAIQRGTGRDSFHPGDRVAAGIHAGWVVSHSEYDANYILVALDIGYIRSFHWAECGHWMPLPDPPEVK
jgi:hypothetical protein